MPRKILGEISIGNDSSFIQNPSEFFPEIIRGNIALEPHSLYALDNNMIVIEILEAAKISAQNGETVLLK